MDPIFLDIVGLAYDPPKLLLDFPKEIGIELYNLDTAGETAVKAFIWKYMDADSNDKHQYIIDFEEYQKSVIRYEEGLSRGVNPEPVEADKLNISEFQDILELKPMIDRAIKLESPLSADLDAINEYLQERIRYVSRKPPLDPDDFDYFAEYAFEELPEGKKGGTILREISTNNDGKLRWKIYKWIYYVWTLGIEVKKCIIPGCGNIFVASNEKRGRPRNRCCSKSCQKIYKNEYNKLYVKHIDRPRRKEQPTKSTEWVEQEALKRLGQQVQSVSQKSIFFG